MTRKPPRVSEERRQAALAELRERASEIREAVRVHVLSAGGLRHGASAANETAEDIAQAVFLKLWAQLREGDPDAIRDLRAYAKKIADNRIVSLLRRPGVRMIETADPDRLERLAAADVAASPQPDGVVERRLSQAQVESIVTDLSPRQALLIKMRTELGMSVTEMARVVGGTPKSCEKQLERAIAVVKKKLAESSDLDSADRRRLSRVMAAKRWGTPTLIAALRRDMRGDLRLASLWRQSNGALHDVAGAVAVDESLARIGAGPRLTERLVAAADRVREGAAAVAGRTGPEHEIAAGAAAGGTGAAKAMIAVCLAGSAAGGACVATGVVDLPRDQTKPPAEKPLAETPTATAPTETTTESPAPPAQTETPTTPIQTQPESPAEQTNTELALRGGSGGSSSQTRDFAAPPGGGGGAGGGSGGGGSGASAFSFEK